jgi:hypothetical protein
MTEDEIGKQVIDVETTIDFLALLASWRENLSSSPTNSAEDPVFNTLHRVNFQPRLISNPGRGIENAIVHAIVVEAAEFSIAAPDRRW